MVSSVAHVCVLICVLICVCAESMADSWNKVGSLCLPWFLFVSALAG